MTSFEEIPRINNSTNQKPGNQKAQPIGTNKNLDHAHPHLCIGENVTEAQQLLFADAQTSGGLLLSVPEENFEEVMKVLEETGAPCATVIGKTIRRQDIAIRLTTS